MKIILSEGIFKLIPYKNKYLEVNLNRPLDYSYLNLTIDSIKCMFPDYWEEFFQETGMGEYFNETLSMQEKSNILHKANKIFNKYYLKQKLILNLEGKTLYVMEKEDKSKLCTIAPGGWIIKWHENKNKI